MLERACARRGRSRRRRLAESATSHRLAGMTFLRPVVTAVIFATLPRFRGEEGVGMKRIVLSVAASFIAVAASAQGPRRHRAGHQAHEDRRHQRRAARPGVGARQGGLQPRQEAQRPEEGRGRQARRRSSATWSRSWPTRARAGRRQARGAPEEVPGEGDRLQADPGRRQNRDLEAAQKKEIGELERPRVPVIKQVGKERGYAWSSTVQSGLVYADEAVDVTDEVLKGSTRRWRVPGREAASSRRGEARRRRRGGGSGRRRRRRNRSRAARRESRRRGPLAETRRAEAAEGNGRGGRELAPAAGFHVRGGCGARSAAASTATRRAL